MEAQKPAEGVLLQRDFGDAMYYRIPCECGCDAEITMSIEVDEDNITAHVYSKTETNYWRNRFSYDYKDGTWLEFVIKDFLNGVYNRVAVAWTALVKGYVTTESYAILTEQQTINFAATLNTAVEELHRRKEADLLKRRAKIKKETDDTQS